MPPAKAAKKPLPPTLEALRSLTPIGDPLVRELFADTFRSMWKAMKGFRKPSRNDLIADLEAIDRELDEASVQVEFAARGGLDRLVVSFVTEAFRFEGIELGRFRVRIFVRPHTHGVDYSAEALEPNPCASNSGTTHPHVSDGHICLGKGASAMAGAAGSGRLLDACEVVLAVLRNHTADAYCPIENWFGNPCGNCGETTDDGPSECLACGGDCCDECGQRSCRDCGETFHRGCIGTCDACGLRTCADCRREDVNGDELCSNCRGTCARCDDYCRVGDLKGGLCPGCRDKEAEEAANEDEEDQTEGDDDGTAQEGQAERVAVEGAQGPRRQPPGRDPSGHPCTGCSERYTPDHLFRGLCAPCYSVQG